MLHTRSRAVFGTALLLFFLAAGPLWASGKVLCSTFPIYLFAENITEGRDFFTLDLMLAGAAGCPHDYAPTPAELEKLSQANILLINGRGLEGFLAQALKVAKADLHIVDASGPNDGPLSDALLLTRDEVMGRDAIHLPDAPNPHLFAAPGSAIRQVERLAEGLAALDPEGAGLYRANAERLAGDLRKIAADFALAGENLGHPSVIISHGIFEFLAGDMGLIVAAAIEEEDGVDPSPARLAQLVTLAKEQSVRAILVDPHGNLELARALGAETKIPVAVIDPVDSGPPEAPPDYYQGVMLTDLDVLVKLFSAPPAPAKKGQK